MATATDKRLTHDDVRRACGAAGGAKEMTCPCCGHGHLQLFARDGIKCQNGCTTEEVVKRCGEILGNGVLPAIKAPTPKKPKAFEQKDWAGFTLADYCKLKRLHPDVLRYYFGLYDAPCKGKLALALPYCDDAGNVLATKLRLSASSHDTFFNPADPKVPYGLNNPLLQNLMAGSYDLFITEGESDCHTLASYNLLAIAITGSQGWVDEYADLPIVQGAKRVFFCRDDDAGGDAFVAKGLRSLPKAFVLRPPEVNDISALHLKYVDYDDSEDPFQQHPFIACIDIAIQAATLDKLTRSRKAAKPAPVIDDAAFYGLPGEIVNVLAPAMEACPAAILANVLACAGVLFQRNAFFQVVADKHYPCDYYLTVGKSSIGRKGTTTNAVLEIIERVQPGFKDAILRGLSTGQGVISALIDPAVEVEEGALPPPKQQCTLVDISEFDELLSVMRREENTLAAVLRDAWDGKSLAVLTRNQPLRVANASLSALANITRRELVEKLTTTAKTNGFANRFLFVWSERSKIVPRGVNIDTLPIGPLVVKLHQAVQAAANLGPVQRDDATSELWDEEYKRLTDRDDSICDSLLARADAHVVRLSLLYALLDGKRVIGLPHLRAALAFWDYCEASVRFIFGDEIDGQAERILRALENGPLTTGELRRLVFKDHITSTALIEKLEATEAARHIRRCEKEGKKGATAAWELAG
jgi:hypothetical protein